MPRPASSGPLSPWERVRVRASATSPTQRSGPLSLWERVRVRALAAPPEVLTNPSLTPPSNSLPQGEGGPDGTAAQSNGLGHPINPLGASPLSPGGRGLGRGGSSSTRTRHASTPYANSFAASRLTFKATP